VLLEEVKATKQAIVDGRLWEHLTVKAQSHPKLWEAFHIFKGLTEYLEDGTPLFKQRAAFFTSPQDQYRPEVVRHCKRLLEDVSIPSSKDVLLILPETETKPLYETPIYQELAASLGGDLRILQVCFLSIPLGLIPVELSDIYPLSQHLAPRDIIPEVEGLVKHVIEFVRKYSYRQVIIVNTSTRHRPLIRQIKKALKTFHLIQIEGETKTSTIVKTVKKAISSAV